MYPHHKKVQQQQHVTGCFKELAHHPPPDHARRRQQGRVQPRILESSRPTSRRRIFLWTTTSTASSRRPCLRRQTRRVTTTSWTCSLQRAGRQLWLETRHHEAIFSVCDSVEEEGMDRHTKETLTSQRTKTNSPSQSASGRCTYQMAERSCEPEVAK